MNRDQLIDYLINAGLGKVSAYGVARQADSSPVVLGDTGTVYSPRPGVYLVHGSRTADTDADRIEHAAKCAS